MDRFESKEQLQDFLLPVLKIRRRNLEKENIIKTEEELFEYIKEEKWKNEKNLYLHEIVDDILHYQIEK